MNYGALISEAFRLTWRNRFLWIFGVFLGGGQVFNLLQNANNLGSQRNASFLGDDAALYVSEARQLVLDNLILFLGLAAALVLAGIFLSLTAQGALIDGAAARHRGLVLISIGTGLLVILPTIFLLVGTLSATDSSTARIPIFILVVLLIVGVFFLISIPLGIIVALGMRALVLDREGVFGSFGSGYDLFRRNLGRSLIVWLVGFTLSLGVGLALLIVALIVGLVLAAPAAALSFAGLGTASLVAGVLAVVVLLILFVVASAAASTFNHAYWTLAYLRLVIPPEGAAGLEA